MKQAINIPGTASNGKGLKASVMKAADKVSAAIGSKEKAAPIDLTPKATVTEPPVMPERAAAPVEEDELTIRQMLADFGIFIPSWKRGLVMAVASFMTGYVVGSSAIALFNFMFGAAIMASGWTFILACVAVIGFVLAMYLACKLANKVARYIGSEQVDRDASRAWGWTKGLFTNAPSNGGRQTV